jgi:S1-C subfamily serine protease
MQITPGSAAVNSGLQQGDLIVEANKRKVKTIDNLKEVLAEVDANLLLRVERGEGAFFLVIQ